MAPKKAGPINYGPEAEKRVNRALAKLTNNGIFHFWFQADRILDAEGIDHVFGTTTPSFRVWVLQVTCGKKKRKTYYKKFSKSEHARAKSPYIKKQYYKYIPLVVVTQKIPDWQIQVKIINISRLYKPALGNRRCPAYVKKLLVTFLKNQGISVPNQE